MSKLSDLILRRTAGALPSSRTSSILDNTLKSNDIDLVKAQLMHVWAHYQALEFMVHDRDTVATIIAKAKLETTEHDVSDIDLILGYYATGAIDVAYDIAHSTSDVIQAGRASTVPEALRFIFSDLDFSDPERELDDDDTINQLLRDLGLSDE